MTAIPNFTTAQLLDTTVEVIDVLRSTLSRGQLWAAGTDAADQEYVVLCWLAKRCNLSVEGIPSWRDGRGRVQGLSTRTRPIMIDWLVSDVKDRIDYTDAIAHEAVWLARKQSVAVSREVRSLMVGVWADTYDDEFADFRAEDNKVA